jgi:hypothetical protein
VRYPQGKVQEHSRINSIGHGYVGFAAKSAPFSFFLGRAAATLGWQGVTALRNEPYGPDQSWRALLGVLKAQLGLNVPPVFPPHQPTHNHPRSPLGECGPCLFSLSFSTLLLFSITIPFVPLSPSFELSPLSLTLYTRPSLHNRSPCTASLLASLPCSTRLKSFHSSSPFQSPI